MDDAAPVPDGERAMARIRRYTTISLVAVQIACIAAGVANHAPRTSAILLGAFIAVGCLVAVHTVWWERRPPVWLSALTIGSALALWTVQVILREMPTGSLAIAMALALHVSLFTRQRLAAGLAGLTIVLAPVFVVAVIHADQNWLIYFASGIVAYGSAVGLFVLNLYAFGLYTEIDAARRVSGELAVARERYRFAADLHDIQGHTLHVIRLKTQLAKRLIDRDPVAAREQLAEAEGLIVETLANTKSLAFGSRSVALASELANARELFVAAGIEWNVTGSAPAESNDELFGLVLRETTTNILRHAQSTVVTVTIEPRRLVVTNDGSPPATRPLSGLARLSERFAAVGGSLRTTVADGVFTTDAGVP